MADLERVPTFVVENQAHDVVSESLNNVTNDIVSGELVKQILTDVQGEKVHDEFVDEVDRIVEDATADLNSLADAEVTATELSESVYDEEDEDIIVDVDESNRHVTGRNSRTISVSLSREASLAQVDIESSESEEELAEESPHETEQEFIIRKSFENYAGYTVSSCRALEAYLTEKRFIQFLREAQLMGIGKELNSTDAEMCYFRNVVNKKRGLFLKDFKAALEDLQTKKVDSTLEEVLYPKIGVHYHPKNFLGAGHYLIHDVYEPPEETSEKLF